MWIERWTGSARMLLVIAVVMLATLVGPATAVADPVPQNGDFAAGLAPWTTTTSCSLCTATAAHDAVGATAESRVEAVVNLALLGEPTLGSVQWTSAAFTRPSGPAPTAARLSLRHAVDGGATLGWSGSATLDVSLVEVGTGTTHPLLSRTGLGISGFVPEDVAVDPALLTDAGDYQLRIDVGVSAPLAVGLWTTLRFDDVVLDVTEAAGPPAPPVTSAPTVSNVATTAGAAAGSVVVAADVTTGGLDTTWWLEWGTTPALGQTVAGGVLGSASAGVRVSATFGNVGAGSSIHWRFVAENAAGRADGPVASYAAPGGDGGGGSGSGSGGGTATTTSTTTVVRTIGGLRCTIVGTAKADRLVGTSRRDVICGLGGNDRIDGRGGNDVIDGGAGADTIRGGAGQDRILGRAGNDRIDGGRGADVVDGGSGNDLLLGGAGRDRLIGNQGRDRLFGGGGRDILIGGAGVDRLVDSRRGTVFRS